MKKSKKQKEEQPFADVGPTMESPPQLIHPPQQGIREEVTSSRAEENTLAQAILKKGEKVRTKGNWIDVTEKELQRYNELKMVVGYDPIARQVLLKS